jgi:endonuclease/exonuclease/phosphatase (EEP) superfamily protein YafD
MDTITRWCRRIVSRETKVMFLTLTAFLFLAVAAVGLISHFTTAGRTWTLGLVAFSPYFMLASPVAAVLLIVARQWIPLVVAGLVVILCVSTQVRLFVASTPPSNGQVLTVMTANLHAGEADPSAIVGAVRSNGVDILMLQELTPRAELGLAAAGLDAVLTHHMTSPKSNAAGTGVWSRNPLVDSAIVPGFGFQFITARVAIPGASNLPTVVALHMSGPVPYPPRWQYDIGRLPSVLRALPTSAPVIVGGDFNATPDTTQFRAVVTDGYRDAADQAGAGLTPTYPSNRWYPPMLSIDHVVTRGAVARSVDSVEIRGSDHRALVARVVLPSPV